MTPLSFYQKMLVVLILSVIIFFGLFHITESPPFGFDEGWATHIATNISRIGIDGTQFSPGNIGHVPLISVGYPLIYALAFWFKIFGVGILQARIMMVVYMLGFAIISFLFLRRLYGNNIALASLAILSTFPPFYTFGKSVIGEVPVLFFLMLFLLSFNLATNNPKRRKFWLILSGVVAGLCIITKTMALVFIPALFVGAFMAWKRKSVSWKDIYIVTISTIIPIIVWIITNFQPGESLAYVADYYSNPSALTDKTATFWLNFRMFWSGIGPLYMLSLIFVWIIGIIIRLKVRTRIFTEEFIALTFSTLLILSFLFRYWDARYLFPVQVLGILFAPYSLYSIWLAMPIKLDIIKKTRIFYFGVIILCILGLYQLSFHSYIADSYKSTRTEDLSRYFSSIPDSTSIFFYNTPNMLPFFHGNNYYQRIAIFEKWVVGSEFAPIVNAGRVNMLVLNPPMTKADEKLSLDNYVEVAKFGKTSILKRKTE